MSIDYGHLPTSDNRFTALCRLHQAKHRATILNEDYGYGPYKRSRSRYANMLIDGEESGSNFITTAAFAFAKEKVKQKATNKGLLIDEYRLFNNMLSSMPMCFNLFSDLRALVLTDQTEASRVVKHLFPELNWIEKVLEIDVEFIPIPIIDYTNDKSAFDAMIIVEDSSGNKGLISIETKYTDLLGSNVAADSEVKNRIVTEGGFFTPQLQAELAEDGYKQIHRNWLLTYAYAQKHGFSHFVNVVISPNSKKNKDDTEIEELKGEMVEHQDTIFKISLQEFVERGCGCECDEIEGVMELFCGRYIAWSE